MAPKNDASKNDYSKTNFIENISEDVAKLSSDLHQPDKFAQIFCEAAKSQKSIDSTLKNVVIELLQKDNATHEAIASIVGQVDRVYLRNLRGFVGFGIWTILLLFLERLLAKFL